MYPIYAHFEPLLIFRYTKNRVLYIHVPHLPLLKPSTLDLVYPLPLPSLPLSQARIGLSEGLALITATQAGFPFYPDLAPDSKETTHYPHFPPYVLITWS